MSALGAHGRRLTADGRRTPHRSTTLVDPYAVCRVPYAVARRAS